MKVTSPKKSSVARKGKLTQGQQFTFGTVQSGRVTVTALGGNRIHVKAEGMRNAPPRDEIVMLVLSGGLSDGDETKFATYLQAFADGGDVPPTTRDLGKRLGLCQSSAQQFLARAQSAGRCINLGNSGARSYVPSSVILDRLSPPAINAKDKRALDAIAKRIGKSAILNYLKTA